MLKAGTIIAEKYRIESVIGKGGMGAVYEARHEQLDKAVALKVLHREFIQDSRALQRFMREARAAASIGHPAIAEASDVGLLPNGTAYLVLELLDGQTLADLLVPGQGLDVPLAAYVVCGVLTGLDAAHRMGIVHRDIKPQNVFLVSSGNEREYPDVKLLDFGVAKIVSSKDAMSLTLKGHAVGTPSYMAPEQALAQDVDQRADVYATGVILYLCLTGQKPFVGSPDVVYDRLLRGQFNPPKSLRSDIPEEIEAAVIKAMATGPEDRYPTAAAMLRALLPFVPKAARSMLRLPSASSVPVTVEQNLVPPVVQRAHAASDDRQPVPDTQVVKAAEPIDGEAGAQSPEPAELPPKPAKSPRVKVTAQPAVPKGKKRAALGWFVAGAGGTLLVACAAFAAYYSFLVLPEQGASPTPATVVEPPAEQQAHQPSPPAAPASRTVTVQITVEPPTATIRIDGIAVGPSPYNGVFPRDGAQHRVDADAQGFAPKAMFVAFDQDRTVNITLDGPADSAAGRTEAPPVESPRPALRDNPYRPAIIDTP